MLSQVTLTKALSHCGQEMVEGSQVGEVVVVVSLAVTEAVLGASIEVDGEDSSRALSELVEARSVEDRKSTANPEAGSIEYSEVARMHCPFNEIVAPSQPSNSKHASIHCSTEAFCTSAYSEEPIKATSHCTRNGGPAKLLGCDRIVSPLHTGQIGEDGVLHAHALRVPSGSVMLQVV